VQNPLWQHGVVDEEMEIKDVDYKDDLDEVEKLEELKIQRI
jgi:hypothetical protein